MFCVLERIIYWFYISMRKGYLTITHLCNNSTRQYST